jgi:hypothetical protein
MSLPNGKASGTDRISSELLKYGGPAAQEMTILLIQLCWQLQEIPQDMSQALIYLIPKVPGKEYDPSQ